MPLPDAPLDLLGRPSPCLLSTLMPDGSPQMTQTWVDTDGHDVLINTVRGHQKVRNVGRDPRVALDVAEPDDPSRYFEARGRVTEVTETAPASTSTGCPSATSAGRTRGSAAGTRSGCWSGSPRRR